MVRLALQYQPSTRALLGAILTDLGKAKLAEKVKKSLNPITTYNITGISSVLTSAIECGIK